MTTIAYKDGIIAYDSRSTRGNLISDDNFNKCAKAGGLVIFFSGSVSDLPHLIDGLTNGAQPPKHSDIVAFVVEDGKVYRAGTHKGELWKENARTVDAIGSGLAHAFTAMDCGRSAAGAVAMAAKRDSGTGGKIKIYKVKS